MKRLLLSITAAVYCLMGFSQEPESFNYKMTVHNSAGHVVASHPVSLKISIIPRSASDTAVYRERHNVTTSQLGLVSLEIGKGTDKTGTFGSIDWSEETYFLKVEVDPAGGTNYVDMGTTQILNVPYASLSEASKDPSQTVSEDRLFLSRKYMGTFVDYRQTGPQTNNGPNIIWIKTSMDKTYGKISAFGKKCEFSVGDKLYLKRTYYSPGGVFGYWVYRIENDSSVYYRVSDVQYDRKIMVDAWFK